VLGGVVSVIAALTIIPAMVAVAPNFFGDTSPNGWYDPARWCCDADRDEHSSDVDESTPHEGEGDDNDDNDGNGSGTRERSKLIPKKQNVALPRHEHSVAPSVRSHQEHCHRTQQRMQRASKANGGVDCPITYDLHLCVCVGFISRVHRNDVGINWLTGRFDIDMRC
jgi:hypothetical protein